MSSEYAAWRMVDGDESLNIDQAHLDVCDLRRVKCEADLRIIAARALRRARAAEIIAAWQAGELSEGQASRMLGWPDDPVATRELMSRIVARCNSRWAMRLPPQLRDDT